MRTLTRTAVAAAIMFGAGTADAQFQCTRISAEDPGPGPGCVNTFDCSGGCTEYTYGLSNVDSYDKIQDLGTSFSFALPQFFTPDSGSFVYSRGTGNILDDNCGFERDYAAMFGRMVIREQDTCDWTDTTTNPNGCPVEMAIDTHAPGEGNFFSSSRVITVAGTISISTAVNGAVSGFGRRMPNTDTPDPDDSLVQMDEVFNGGGNSFGCCSTHTGVPISLCEANVFLEYPDITALAGSAFTTSNMAALLFEAGPGSNFAMDETFELANQEFGVCRANRFVACDRTNLGTVCPNLDASLQGLNPGDPGFVPDECDFRELGWRFQPADVLADGSPNPVRCNTAPFFFRGVADAFCSVSENYIDDGVLGVDGDPGPDCTVRNYGPYFRPDLNCNGVDDTDEADTCNVAEGVCDFKILRECATDFDCRATGDLCPLFSEVNAFNDSNGNGRGDECECGDGGRDGFPDITDILQANTFIFNPPLSLEPPVSIRLTHPNLSTQNHLGFFGATDINDILNINNSIFNPGDLSSVCPRVCTGFPVADEDGDGREALRRIPANEINCVD